MNLDHLLGTPQDYGITNYKFNSDGTLDVFGDVFLCNKGLTELPFDFNMVEGGFNCDNNKLISLKGCPKIVTGDFYCRRNSIVSLEFGPQEVGGSFVCSYNSLTSLCYAPKSVGHDFKCNHNKITSLEGLPRHIKGMLNCSYNQLYSLAWDCETRSWLICEGNPFNKPRRY